MYSSSSCVGRKKLWLFFTSAEDLEFCDAQADMCRGRQTYWEAATVMILSLSTEEQKIRDNGAVNCAPSPAGHPSFCTCFHAAYRVDTTFWRFLVLKLTSSYVADFSRRGSWKPETGSQELESRLWKPEAKSQKPETRSREWGTGSRKLGAGIQD